MKNRLYKRIYGVSLLSFALVLSSCLSSYEKRFTKKSYPDIQTPDDGTLVTLPDGSIRFYCALYKYRDEDGRNDGKRAFTFVRPNTNSGYLKFFCGVQTSPSNLGQKREIDLGALSTSCAGDTMNWDIISYDQHELQDRSTVIFPEDQNLKRVMITVVCNK